MCMVSHNISHHQIEICLISCTARSPEIFTFNSGNKISPQGLAIIWIIIYLIVRFTFLDSNLDGNIAELLFMQTNYKSLIRKIKCASEAEWLFT